MDASSPCQAGRLPESVERIIKRIREEKKQPALKNYVRSMLAEIGEKASMDMLTKILSSKNTINSFSGYLSYLIKNEYPIVASNVLRVYTSPSSTSPYISSHKLSMSKFY
ncbi:hypothetical protein OROGR_018458 [Orobanche gracilis]